MTFARCAAIAAWALASPLAAQDPTAVSVTVVARRDTMPVSDVLVRSDGTVRYTDTAGRVVLRLVPGEHQIVTAKIGYKAESVMVTLRAGVDTTVLIALVEQPLELSGIVVSATRSGRRIEDEPLRVETLAQEEVEEKL